MDVHSLRVLEFDAVLECLAAEAASILGRQRALAVAPSADPALVVQRLTETREARTLLAHGPAPALERAADVRESLARAGIAGARLSPPDLLAIAETLEAAEQLRQWVRRPDLDLPRLSAVSAGLRPPSALWREIRRCILPDGTVTDTASAELSRLRTQARAAREAAREHLQALLGSPQLHGVIAEPVITLRNDRYVIPVLAGYRVHLAGVVQDQSGSGHTLFLEPLSVVEQNNAIRRLEREAESEVDRILGDLTAKIGAAGDDIRATVEALADLDLILGRARLAERWGATQPTVDPEGSLCLRGARHPLLLESRRRRATDADLQEVVPIDVPLERSGRVLVITGPNAGGKTVALKTVGLLVLMAQAGLHIPASPDSSWPVFRGVYADIGDEQSIARDLSTFSAHVSRLTAILAAADGSSLVLIDEIGAGTDPGEGAALGNAILEALAGRGSHVVATTHLDGIKAFVANHPAMVNAAVEFDLDRMRPVYKLHIGFPGRSFAIDVACRLGIPPSIVQRAREFVGDSGAGVAALLDQLHVLESQRAEQAAAATRERAEAVRAREEAENIVRDLRVKAASLRARTGQVVAEIAAEARRRVEAVVADLKRGRAVQEARHAVGQLADLPEAVLAEFPAPPPGAEDTPLERIEPGQQVRIRHLGQVGTVVSEVSAQGLVEVQLPVGKARVPVTALSGAGPAIPRREAPISWTAGAGESLTAEINVIGCTVEEATQRVARYLDDAMLGGLSRVRIIHGKGTGRLRRGIAELLQAHPLVAGFQIASFDEGGTGATVVDLGAREGEGHPPAPPPDAM